MSHKTPSIAGIPLGSKWWRHSFVVLIEHGITRVSDSLISLSLIWAVTPEKFAVLAMAQAVVAPASLFFVSPSTAFLRDFGTWKRTGDAEVAAQLRSFRTFAWGTAGLSVLLSFALAIPFDLQGADYAERCFALLWAFGMAMAQFMSTPDRDFLRMELDFSGANQMNLIQRLSMLLGTLAILVLVRDTFAWLAIWAWCVTLVTAGLSRRIAEGRLKKSARSLPWLQQARFVFSSIRGVGLWNHLSGIVFSTLQTFPVLLAGALMLEPMTTGVLASVGKLANLAFAIPLAFSNAFSVWLARRFVAPNEGPERVEYHRLRAFLVGVVAIAVVQILILWLLAPWLTDLLSRGRWPEQYLVESVSWLPWLALSTLPLLLASAASVWWVARKDPARVFWRVYAPWGLAAYALLAAIQRRWIELDPSPGTAVRVSLLVSFSLLLPVGLEVLQTSSKRNR
jgi:hypothetical protein